MRQRMSISVPEDLRSKMDAVSGVNWSAIASEAFRRVLAEKQTMNHIARELIAVVREKLDELEAEIESG